MYTLVVMPKATANFAHYPWAIVVVLISVLAIANIPRAVYAERPVQAFASSAVTIASLVFLFSFALFPNLVTASNGAENSLTVYNASSSPGHIVDDVHHCFDRNAVRAYLHSCGLLGIPWPGRAHRTQLLAKEKGQIICPFATSIRFATGIVTSWSPSNRGTCSIAFGGFCFIMKQDIDDGSKRVP